MLEDLKREVLEANLELWRKGLILFTWGNASGCDRRLSLVVIKPSGVPYDQLSADKLVVVDLEGQPVEGNFSPSLDTPTHLEIYKAFPQVCGVAHSHSTYAVIWAQARRPIPAFGTTHADYFHGEVPLTRPLTPQEIKRGYEVNTGRVIVERFRQLDPLAAPGVLVNSHGPFTWGRSAAEAVENMAVLEEVARMAWGTLHIDPDTPPMQRELLDKHYFRKHGGKRYYGQKQKS